MKRKGNNIGWCDKTANPVCGCPNGCEYCYARSMNNRFHWVPDFSKPQFFPNRLKEFRTKEPMIIFIDSMSDIAHWEPFWITDTVAAMVENNHNIYLALTKSYVAINRIKRLYSDSIPCPANFLIGATVTNNAQAQAVIDAGGADFISFEPLMERISPDVLCSLRCMWWIVGDLTKNGKPQHVTRTDWIEEMSEQATAYKIPFFMKDSLEDRLFCFGSDLRKEFPQGWKL